MTPQYIIHSSAAAKKSAVTIKRCLIFWVFAAACIFIIPAQSLSGPGDKITAAKTGTAANKPFMGSPAVQLQIHHINVNNGDASIIKIIHLDGTETKVLIDGGQSDPAAFLLPYINRMCANKNFQYTILTHYHNDHYNGLSALGDGRITSDYYIDLGGYNMTNYVSTGKLPLIQPNDKTCPWTDDSTGVFDGVGMPEYIQAVGLAAENFGMQRYMPMSKDVNNIQATVGTIIPLDTFLVGTVKVPINLRCVAAWGYTQASGQVIDNWNRGASKNDPSLGFVLECGEFRYFFGGDMGGEASGSYIDQETTLAEGFTSLYSSSQSYTKPAGSFSGHICGFKANHHGSAHSNNSTFLGRMRPAVCVTSAGSNTGWHLPSVPFIQRLNATKPITEAADVPTGILAQGFFFTNLYNFGDQNNSLNVATALFSKRSKTAFEYGSKTGAIKMGYVVTAYLNIPQIDLTKGSVFTVVAVDDQYKFGPFIQTTYCHQK